MVNKIFVFNVSMAMELSAKLFVSFMRGCTKAKLVQIKKDYSAVVEAYAGEQLEVRFGGKMGNIRKFWPPVNTVAGGSRKSVVIDVTLEYVEIIYKAPEITEKEYVPTNFVNEEA